MMVDQSAATEADTDDVWTSEGFWSPQTLQ